MTEQPTTPPESAPLRLPRLGYGIHWSDIVAEIDRDHRARQRAAEPAASPEVAKEEVPQVEPAPGLTDHSSTPSLGEAGSSLGALVYELGALGTPVDPCWPFGLPRVIKPATRVVPLGEPFRPLADVLDPTPQPSEHQHIWTTTSPVRCVECRRYLSPWWRRALDRVRRWGR